MANSLATLLAVQCNPAPAVAPAKALRYAPVQVLSNPAAVITSMVSNPKRPGTRAHLQYSRFQVGQSIAQIEALFIAEGSTSFRARNEIRWCVEHGFITLGLPVAG